MLDMDNDIISEAVVERKELRMSDDLNNTLNEDSYFPHNSVPECKRLLEEVDKVIRKEVHSELQTVNQWAHILEPNEQTMFHHHGSREQMMPGISWVYYPEVPKNSGNIVWTFEANAQRMTEEAEPKVGKLILFGQNVPHFTKKNNSGKRRISISGNAAFNPESPPPNDPGALLNYVGLFRG